MRYARLGAQVGWVPTRVLWPSSARPDADRRSTCAARRLRAYDDGRLRLSVRVAIGAPASPTPRGRFYLRERVPVIDAGDLALRRRWRSG